MRKKGIMSTKEESRNIREIVISETLEREIRFNSGKTIYIERLIGGQWVSWYWGFDSLTNSSFGQFAEPAFEIQIKSDLFAAKGTWLSGNWQWVSSTELSETESGARYMV